MKEKEKRILEAFYRLIVKDKKGQIISDTGEQRSHSFVLQFLEAFYAAAGNASYNVTIIAGTEESWAAAAVISLDGAAGNVYEGIVVGTGSTAESNSDVALATLIAHGVGAGQLSYGTQAFTAPVVTAGNVDFVLDRTFTNGSGDSITVAEIGIHMQETTATGATTCRLMIRDVLSSTVAVGNGLAFTVQYTLRTTV